MLINESNLDLVYKGFKASYTDAYLAAEVNWDKIAMTVASSGSEETYGWIGAVPQLREWIGPRHVKGLMAHAFTIRNRKFESTVAIPRDNISDDKLGVFKPAFQLMGQGARTHPEELIFALLAAGFETQCFDGQNFFDTDHPSKDKDGNPVTVSNMDATGGGAAWFLLDTSKPVKPIIWQEREKYEFTQLTRADDTNVFINDEYLYGVRARVNAGFGLWQLGYGSVNDLTEANYAAARAAMMNFRSDEGRLLGIKPTALVVPPALEDAALHLLNTETKDGGGSNPYKATADLIVTPWLEA
ncbi:Mu-like prophage major head subunit gpT family protein [Thalassococcus sp. CAU 1522]|uniref:Mu-like prophage major head subunit gpT family protein n=1 Tax=Thalassococcus arenae TaxID=2851652 RepID=A0ABS6NAD9_9RHOB|nr:Mu-like prophage major head subunit gpT family protein [Thalassococcus arenae]MBV2360991.1 Mu-like prophage major head subunit gpT family protein [Thalassococcus arenae]